MEDTMVSYPEELLHVSLGFGRKLTWQWKMDLLKMYSLLTKGGMFHCHLSLLEGIKGAEKCTLAKAKYTNMSPYM